MIEGALAPVLLRIARRRIFGDFLLHRAIGAPVEGAALMNGMQRVDDGGGNGKIEARYSAFLAEAMQQRQF